MVLSLKSFLSLYICTHVQKYLVEFFFFLTHPCGCSKWDYQKFKSQCKS